MPVTLIDILKPKNSQPFPLVEDIDLLGGFRVVVADANRDAIGYKLKKDGMLVLVNTTKIIWSWNAPLSIWEVAIDLNNQGGAASQPGVYTAACPALALAGDLVRPVASTETAVDFVDVTDLTKMPAIGVVTSKPSSTTATVQTSGIVTGVFSGLQPGKRYFSGKNSRPALAAALIPGPGELLFHQPIGLAIDYSIMLMTPSMNLTRVRGN
jgi:hypothetical protein